MVKEAKAGLRSRMTRAGAEVRLPSERVLCVEDARFAAAEGRGEAGAQGDPELREGE